MGDTEERQSWNCKVRLSGRRRRLKKGEHVPKKPLPQRSLRFEDPEFPCPIGIGILKLAGPSSRLGLAFLEFAADKDPVRIFVCDLRRDLTVATA
jgi:hypothetical protein